MDRHAVALIVITLDASTSAILLGQRIGRSHRTPDVCGTLERLQLATWIYDKIFIIARSLTRPLDGRLRTRNKVKFPTVLEPASDVFIDNSCAGE